MNLMASAFLMLLAVVGMVVFIADLTIVDSSLLVPLDTLTTPPTTTTTTTTTKRPFSCKRMMLSMGKRVFKTYGICNRDMKVFIPDMHERAKKFNCSTKCVLRKLHVVNEKLKIDHDSMQMFFDTFLPEPFQEIAHFTTEGCVDDFKAKGEEAVNEEYCDSYGEFLDCIQSTFQGACGV